MNETAVIILTSSEAADLLGISVRSIQKLGKLWEDTAKGAFDPYLPSSPKNGLRRSRICDERHRYHPGDLQEYEQNATLELLGQPLVSWRKEQRNG